MALMPSRLHASRALFRAGWCIPTLAMMLLARPARAQRAGLFGGVVTDSVCSYRTCALTIAPRWNGLAVIAGNEGPQLANLHFLVPRNVTAVLAGTHAAVTATGGATHRSPEWAVRRCYSAFRFNSPRTARSVVPCGGTTCGTCDERARDWCDTTRSDPGHPRR